MQDFFLKNKELLFITSALLFVLFATDGFATPNSGNQGPAPLAAAVAARHQPHSDCSLLASSRLCLVFKETPAEVPNANFNRHLRAYYRLHARHVCSHDSISFGGTSVRHGID